MPASASVDAERASSWRLVNDFFAPIAIATQGPPSNHDGGCPLNLTPGLRFYDSRMTQRRGRHSGMVRRTRPQMCNCTSGNLEIPGSMLCIAPE